MPFKFQPKNSRIPRLIFGLLLSQAVSLSLSVTAHALPVTILPQSQLLSEDKERPANTSPDLLEGQRLLSSGETEKAVNVFKQYTQNHREDGEGFFWLGTALNEVGDAKDSVEAFAQAVELNSNAGNDSSQLRVNYGNTLLLLDRVEEALFQYHKAISLDPNEARAYFNLARALIQEETPVTAEAALANLNKSEALGINHPDIGRYKAMCYIILSQNQEAADALNQYLTQIPDDEADVPLRQTIQETISELLETQQPASKLSEHETTVPRERKYTLSPEVAYAVLDVDEKAHLITLDAEDGRDPDDGAQDGKNDGIFQMSLDVFETQVPHQIVGERPQATKSAIPQ